MVDETKGQLEEQAAESETKQNDQESESPNVKGETLTHLVAGTTPQNELLTMFIGPNAETFLGSAGLGLGAKKGWSFNWVAAFFALPWFFYRKMFLIGLAILLVPIMITVIFPQFAEFNIGVGGAIGATANSLYLWHANRKIDKLKKLELSSDELKDKINKAGGTSTGGAVFGCLIVLALIALPFLEKASATLPDCNNAQVQKMAGTLLSDVLTNNGVDVEGLKVYDFKRVEGEPDTSMNICSYTADLKVESRTLYLSVTWKDKEKGEYQVRIGNSQENVSQPLPEVAEQ